MTLSRLLTGLLGCLVPVLAVALVLQHGDDRRLRHERTPTPPAASAASEAPELHAASYAEAAAANYKVLSPRQSRRLIAFAGGLAACLRKRGIEIGAPKASRTRIELALPGGARRRVVLSRATACGDLLGGPPPGASVQFRPTVNAILVYLPKYCLLDPNVSDE